MSDEMPTAIPFQHSSTGTLGVEMEWMTVDQSSGAQIPAAPAVFAVTSPSPRIKPELFTSTVEINTDIHHTTPAAITQLQALYDQVSNILSGQQAALLSTGTHPFSHWREQQVSDDPRYTRLLDRLQWMARRFNIFGIHVHIGMPDGDSCIHAMNHLLPVLPIFLAISANSPFWHGEDTGLSASRIKIFEGLSQGGMPFYFQNWQDFEHCAGRLQATGSIDSVRDIWWEMRPHPDFGTLEVRIGDMPACRDDAAAYIAYVRAEAMAALHADPIPRIHPSLIRENRWRACRFGIHATVIDPLTEQLIPVLDWLETRLERLDRCGIDRSELALVAGRIASWRRHGGGDAIQRQIFSRRSSFPDLVRAIRLQDGWNS